MVKKRGKTVSFDAMVKFFMQAYQIPTKRDVEKILDGVARIEEQLKILMDQMPPGTRKKTPIRKRSASSASDRVLEVIRKHKNGIDVAGIQAKTGFGDKKLRNILFRLHKLEKIQRKSRGVYMKA